MKIRKWLVLKTGCSCHKQYRRSAKIDIVLELSWLGPKIDGYWEGQFSGKYGKGKASGFADVGADWYVVLGMSTPWNLSAFQSMERPYAHDKPVIGILRYDLPVP